MPTEVKKIRIFVASPGDVQSERNQLLKVINELNLTISAIAPEKNMILELVRWETHVAPIIGPKIQKEINEQIGDYDIFIGIIWKRMGTATSEARSGTEEEFNRAYKIWEQNKNFPILFYFCQQSFPPPHTKEEVEQLGKVVDFREQLTSKGLIADYADHECFDDVVRPHLLIILGKNFSPENSVVKTAEQLAENSENLDVSGVRQKVVALAEEYVLTRASMEASDTRTRKMALIVSKMRTHALSAYSLLPELAVSASTGERLFAVAILQSIPNANYITWLAERFKIEKPFIRYQAATALLAAVRNLPKSDHQELRKAITLGKKDLMRSNIARESSDQIAVLDEAEKELNQRLISNPETVN